MSQYMNKYINFANNIQLEKIQNGLFDIANSYAGDEHGHIAQRLHRLSNEVYEIRETLKKLYT